VQILGSAEHGSAVFIFPSGAKIRTGHLKDKSYEKYLGQEYQCILIEELTLIPSELDYVKILGSCRSTVPGVMPQIFCTTNPGNIGHAWVKKRFVDPAQPGTPFIPAGNVSRKRIFIPSRLEDNPILMLSDPGYVEYLESLKVVDPKLYKAWRLGMWDVFEGQFFDTWMSYTPDMKGYHVIDPFPMPQYWKRFIAIDWGYYPGWFEALWFAVVPDGEIGWLPRRIYVYRQLSLQKSTPGDAAKKMIKLSGNDPIAYIVMDPSAFNQRRGDILREVAPSIKDQMVEEAKIPNQLFRRANNDRINGWMECRKYLAQAPDGMPWLQFFKNCERAVSTIPFLVHDKNNPEDLDTEGDDHSGDAWRYGVMTRLFKGSGAIIRAQMEDIEKALTETFIVDEDHQMPILIKELVKKQLRGELDFPSRGR
jgi:hypothetical protein